MKTIVRNGTPIHGENLCLTCSSCILRRGHRVSEEEIYCYAMSGEHGPRQVPFAVAECTSYRDKRLEHSDSYYSTAWVLIPDVGYVPPDEYRRRQQAGQAVPSCQ